MKWLARLHRSTSQKYYLKVVRKTSCQILRTVSGDRRRQQVAASGWILGEGERECCGPPPRL